MIRLKSRVYCHSQATYQRLETMNRNRQKGRRHDSHRAVGPFNQSFINQSIFNLNLEYRFGNRLFPYGGHFRKIYEPITYLTNQ